MTAITATSTAPASAPGAGVANDPITTTIARLTGAGNLWFDSTIRRRWYDAMWTIDTWVTITDELCCGMPAGFAELEGTFLTCHDDDDARRGRCVAHVQAFAWDGDVAADFDELCGDCEEMGVSLECVASRLADLWVDVDPSAARRLLILDRVELAPLWLGAGLGRRAAAHALHAGGCWADQVMAAAIAGSWSSDETEFETIATRAELLLAAIGLDRYAVGAGVVFVGTPGDSGSRDEVAVLL